MLESEVKARHRYCLQSQEFVKRGFVVAIPMRRGYGKSSGQKNQVRMNITTFGMENAKDIQATIDFMRREPYVDGKKLFWLDNPGAAWPHWLMVAWPIRTLRESSILPED